MIGMHSLLLEAILISLFPQVPLDMTTNPHTLRVQLYGAGSLHQCVHRAAQTTVSRLDVSAREICEGVFSKSIVWASPEWSILGPSSTARLSGLD